MGSSLSFDDFPVELRDLIVCHIDLKEPNIMALVCKHFSKMKMTKQTLVCKYAALNGHLEVLKWARENGCPER